MHPPASQVHASPVAACCAGYARHRWGGGTASIHHSYDDDDLHQHMAQTHCMGG